MTPLISLKEIERTAYKSTFQDGLWDIFLGLVFLGWAVPSLLANIGVPSPLNDAFMPLLALLILFFGKRWITIPRMGLVRFGPKRQANRKKTLIVLILSLSVTTMLLVAIRMQSPSNSRPRVTCFRDLPVQVLHAE